MGKIVVAQIGKTKYDSTIYKKFENEEGVYSKYSFEAVIREALNEGPGRVDLILLGTKDSYFGSLYLDFSSDVSSSLVFDQLKDDIIFREGKEILLGKMVNQIEDVKNSEVRAQYEDDLSRKLTEHFRYRAKIAVTVAIIDQGQSGEELSENFEVIRTAVEGVIQPKEPTGHWKIYFDITNGFRSFPIYIYTLTSYLYRVRENQTSCHIYYGMFDVSKKLGYAPLVNLQIVDDLLQLINAVSEFQNCGSVKQILEILKNHPKWDIKIGINEKETLSYAFEMFDYGTNANNLRIIEKGIDLLKGIGNEVQKANLNEAERLLLNKIAIDFKNDFSYSDTNYPFSNLLIQLANWYHKTGREGNAVIALQEMIVTYILERYPDLSKKYLLDLPSSPVQESDNLTETTKLFDYNIRSKIKKALSKLDSQADFSIFSTSYQYIYCEQDIRNTMAHIIYHLPDPEDGYGSVLKQYKEEISTLINCMSTEMQKAEGQSISDEAPSLGRSFAEGLFMEKLGDILKEMLDHPEEEIQGTSDYLIKFEELRSQIIIRKNSSNFDEFYKCRNNMKLLFLIFDFWMKKRPNPVSEPYTKADYHGCYEDESGRSKYNNMINFIKNRYKEIIPIILGTTRPKSIIEQTSQ